MKYCYWSVCDGEYAALMGNCVRTARAAGVFKEFHVLTDRPIDGCECYDAHKCDKGNGLFKLHYLKVGMSRLPFEYFVWVDADTIFVRNPVDILGSLSRSPIHVPLEADLSAVPQDAVRNGTAVGHLCALMRKSGVTNRPYLCQSAFWIVHSAAINTVYDLALGFWHKAKDDGLVLNVSAALGYAMQMLCADPGGHQVTCRTDLWATGDQDDPQAVSNPWLWRQPLAATEFVVHPAIVHLPRSKARAPGLG